MALSQFKSRRKAKRIIYSPVAIAVLALVLAVMAKATWGMYDKYRVSVDRLGQADAQMSDLKGQEGSLSDSIASLSTKAGAEAALRSNFRVVKPGESLAVIVDAQATSAAATSTPGGGFWSKLFGWF